MGRGLPAMMSRSPTTWLLALPLLLGACASHRPARVAPRAPRFWHVRDAGAGPARLREVQSALLRCEAGLASRFVRAPGPLAVIAYGDRRAFVQGLRDELHFDPTSAAYFARSSAPRPLRGKLLVPPDMSAANVCHEVVHHYLEASLDRKIKQDAGIRG